jgi:hypothetical protein
VRAGARTVRRALAGIVLLAALVLAGGGCATGPATPAEPAPPGALDLPAGDRGRVHVGGEIRLGVEFGR